MKYKFKLPIGDWSNDGHGKCDWYIVQSNKPLEEVREAYFKACKLSGIEFHEYLCSDYEDGCISLDQIEYFKEIGIDVLPLLDEEFDEEFKNDTYVGVDGFVSILFKFIIKYTPDLELDTINDGLEMFPFYGFDHQNRHIGHLGYGLFY